MDQFSRLSHRHRRYPHLEFCNGGGDAPRADTWDQILVAFGRAFRAHAALEGVPKAWISARIGGDQIDYADESQAVRTRFQDALAQNNLTPAMDEFYEAEIPDLPPKPAQAAG